MDNSTKARALPHQSPQWWKTDTETFNLSIWIEQRCVRAHKLVVAVLCTGNGACSGVESCSVEILWSQLTLNMDLSD